MREPAQRMILNIVWFNVNNLDDFCQMKEKKEDERLEMRDFGRKSGE